MLLGTPESSGGLSKCLLGGGVLGEQQSMKPAKNLNLPLPEPKFPQVRMP